MKKQALIELVRNELTGGSPQAENMQKFHVADIEMKCSLAYDRIMLEVYQASKIKKDFSVFDSVSKPYIYDVEKDETRDEYYIDIPVSFVSIPNYIAIRQMSNPKNRKDTYSYMPQNMIVNVTNSSVNKVSDHIHYYLESQRAYFFRLPEGVKQVMVQIVQSFTEYEDTDEIPVPNSMNGTIFDLVMSRILPTVADKNNDSSFMMGMEKR